MAQLLQGGVVELADSLELIIRLPGNKYVRVEVHESYGYPGTMPATSLAYTEVVKIDEGIFAKPPK